LVLSVAPRSSPGPSWQSDRGPWGHPAAPSDPGRGAPHSRKGGCHRKSAPSCLLGWGRGEPPTGPASHTRYGRLSLRLGTRYRSCPCSR